MLSGQDSAMIKETCSMIHNLKNIDDIDSQSKIYLQQMKTYYLPSPAIIEGESKKQAFFRYNYKFIREMKRNCPESIIPVTFLKAYLTDIEDLFDKKEVDSLEHTLMTLSAEKKIYIHIITIDDYYPFNSIEDFAEKNRDVWSYKTIFNRGTILIAISSTKRQIRISTSDSAMDFLTDKDCTEVNDRMTFYFKKGNYFEGLLAGVKNLQTKIK